MHGAYDETTVHIVHVYLNHYNSYYFSRIQEAVCIEGHDQLAASGEAQATQVIASTKSHECLLWVLCLAS